MGLFIAGFLIAYLEEFTNSTKGNVAAFMVLFSAIVGTLGFVFWLLGYRGKKNYKFYLAITGNGLMFLWFLTLVAMVVYKLSTQYFLHG